MVMYHVRKSKITLKTNPNFISIVFDFQGIYSFWPWGPSIEIQQPQDVLLNADCASCAVWFYWWRPKATLRNCSWIFNFNTCIHIDINDMCVYPIGLLSGIFIFTCTINPNDSNLMYKYVLHGSYGIQRRLGDSTLAWTHGLDFHSTTLKQNLYKVGPY